MIAKRTAEGSQASSYDAPQDCPAEKARQGEIILKTKLARAIFFTGLFGGIVSFWS
ncbi:MAG: peptide ABC transporter permease [Methyloceanibacter sp.]|uniref:peptide ABC transporter permease n=1 Tax=Methyloceanibacter sp. TaxID=1965321 RepID=UPI003D6D8301